MFNGKTTQQLTEMQREIEKTLINPELLGVMDFEYWENVQKMLKLHKAI